MTTVFLTGFPGFVASRLITALLSKYADYQFLCLVQPKFLKLAGDQLKTLEEKNPAVRGKIHFLSGDMLEPSCGLTPEVLADLKDSVEDVWHLAAVYDLAIPREIGYRINVEGTRQVISLAKSFRKLKNFFYISTAYVSGKRTGTIYEEELDAGQSFKNYYEETKFLAEVEVRKVRHELPVTIFRPGILVGDSVTGETQKLDGPYFVIQLLDRLSDKVPFLLLGSGNNTTNLVPVDFCVNAMAWIATKTMGTGKVYHLTDPEPLTQRELARLFAENLEKSFSYLPVPAVAARLLLKIPFISRLMGLPSVVVDYFDHPHKYDCSNTLEALKGSGLSCPPIRSYAPVMISYFKQAKEEMKTKKALY